FFRNFGGFEESFNDALARQSTNNAGVQLIHFPKAYRSTEESEMVLDGLVDADKNARQQTADLYVWGTYTTARMPARGQRPEQHRNFTFHIGEGVPNPLKTTKKLPPAAKPDEIQNVLDRLAKETFAHATKRATGIDS